MTDPRSISLIISGLAAYFVWHYGWRTYHLDNYRDNLFAIRDRLFAKGINGEIPFDSSAYQGMEQYVNLHIRFAHRFTLMDAFATMFWPRSLKERAKNMSIGSAKEWSMGITSDKTREYIKSFERVVMGQTFGFVTSYNLAFLFLKLATAVTWILRRFGIAIFNSAITSFKNIFDAVIKGVIADFEQSPKILAAS